jgi:Double zinc ribbon
MRSRVKGEKGKEERPGCPYCDEDVKNARLPFCKPCEVSLPYCAKCREVVPKDATTCPYCGAKLRNI